MRVKVKSKCKTKLRISIETGLYKKNTSEICMLDKTLCLGIKKLYH